MSDDSKHAADPLMGTIQHGGFISEDPPDVEEFLTDVGLAEKPYSFTIKRAPKEGSATKDFMPVNMKGTYLPIEECGKRFGPGQYFYCFSWMGKDPENPSKNKKVFKEYKIYLGTEWEDIYDDYQAEKWQQKQKKIENLAMRKKVQDAAKGILPDDDKKGGASDPIENLKNTMSVLKDLEVPIGGARVPATKDDNTMLAMMMNMQNENTKNTMQMFMTMNANMMQMFTAILANNRPQNNNEMMKEVLNMVTSAVDLKQALNPDKEGIVDKVFNIAQSALPAILQLAQQPKAQRMNDPLVNMVKESDNFAKIKNDPELLNALISRWDEVHGARKTDIILETVGLSRPGGPVHTDEPEETESPEEEAEYTDVGADGAEGDENLNPLE